MVSWGEKLLGGSHSQDGLNDFSETFASFLACDKGGEVLHAFGEAKDVLHAGGMPEILEHGFVIGRISAEDETISVVIQLQATLLEHKELCHPELVVVSEPAINMDRRHLAGGAVFFEDVADFFHLLPR